jgi:large subunit ribosomal protein L30
VIAMSEQPTRLRVTQVKSGIGYHYTQKATLRSLGFRRLYQTIDVADTPSVRGMLRKVSHLVRIDEPAPGAEADKAHA